MTPEDQKSRDEFEEYWRERQIRTHRYTDRPCPDDWGLAFKADAEAAWAASRRTYRDARLAELEEEVAIDDKLLAIQYRLMDAIPGCEMHGNRCVPGAIEWVTTIQAKTLEEAAQVAQAEPRVWDQSAPDPQTRIAGKLRALAAKTREG
jgi:hypothetical protein